MDLINIGRPDFIEVKGVTFAGGGKLNQLTMSNVPWHEEVISFCESLASCLSKQNDLSIRYEIASEHEHSCCILLANVEKFKIEGRWHTWIDFDKFIQLQAADHPFSSVDYLEPTPDWAVFGAKERGFDPVEMRFKGNRPTMAEGVSMTSEIARKTDEEEGYLPGGC